MKKKLVGLGLAVATAWGVLAPTGAMATEVNLGGGQSVNIGMSQEDICSRADLDPLEREAAGCDKKTEENNIGNTVQTIINTVIAILGIVAVLFVVIGGAQYMTSQGDPAKTKRAKDTILYAVLGVILAAMAYAIVNFVLSGLFS